MAKTYEHHRFQSFKDIENDKTKNKDRKYIMGTLNNVTQYCKQNEIHFIGEFAAKFKNIGFKSKDISKLLINYIKSFPLKDFKWVSIRTLSKANFDELDIILTKVIHRDKDEFEKFIIDNIHSRNQIEIQMIISEINNEMDEIEKRSKGFSLLNNDSTDDGADFDISECPMEDLYFCDQYVCSTEI